MWLSNITGLVTEFKENVPVCARPILPDAKSIVLAVNLVLPINDEPLSVLNIIAPLAEFDAVLIPFKIIK